MIQLVHIKFALQAGAYYMGMLAYYWVLATPAVGFLFGCYLYIAVNWFHVHYDEAFSALRIPNFKGFSRLHINTNGDLEVYGLAMDKVTPDAFCLQSLTASSPFAFTSMLNSMFS